LDNLTHSLVGWTLGQTGLKRKTRKGLAALILGANMPDIDVFLGWVPWAPLATHRGFTHGIVGVLVMPPILAGLLWLLDRWQVRRGAEFKSELAMHFGWLVGLSYIATFTHPLLDWQTTYSVQLLSPFSNLWFHNDALFIIDVWIWVGLGIAIWLSRRRERAESNWQLPATTGLAVLVAYITVNGMWSAWAKMDTELAESRDFDTIYASPPPFAFWQREMAWRAGETVGWREFGSFAPPQDRSTPISDNMADPLVREAIGSPQLLPFARWSTMPIAQVERGRCTARVLFGDARYGRSVTDNRFARQFTVPTGAPGCPDPHLAAKPR